MSAAKERERRKVKEEERTNGRIEGQGKERMRKPRRESTATTKWQSLPGAYNKGLLALPGIQLLAVTMKRSACHHLVTALHH